MILHLTTLMSRSYSCTIECSVINSRLDKFFLYKGDSSIFRKNESPRGMVHDLLHLFRV